MVTLTINGARVSVEKGSTLLEAAEFMGFPIPTLCHMEGLPPTGACRMCVVEDMGSGNLIPSCSMPAHDGMEIKTHSPKALNARRTIIELPV